LGTKFWNFVWLVLWGTHFQVDGAILFAPAWSWPFLTLSFSLRPVFFPWLVHWVDAFEWIVGIRLVLHRLVQKEPGDDALIASVHGA